MEAHLEGERLGLDDLTARLRPEEMRLLREKPGRESAWPPEAFERIESLVALGESRRAALRPRVDPSARELYATRVLLVGFPAAERRKLSAFFERTPGGRFLVRAAESVEVARSLTSRSAFDVALLNLLPDAGSGPAQLARAEVATSGIPVVAVVSGEYGETLGDLGVYDVLVKDGLDAETLVRQVERSVGRRRATDALHDPEKETEPTATRDATTGLPNLSALREQLERALHHAERHGEQVAVLLLEIERFDAFARRLGRDMTESLLITVAERLRGAVRKSDLIARVSDSVFVALLQGRDLDYVPARAAERMLECLARSFVVDGVEHDMTASVGVSTHPRDAVDGESLLRHAASALETARAAGRNCYRFYGRIENAAELRRQALAERIRGALGRGDLRVHYQPRVDGRSGAIVGVEALLRWTDEKLGCVSPDEFVPVAERSGLMCEIGSWVMREACRAHARWRAEGFGGLRLSVNVSAHQVQSASLRDAVVEAVMETGLPANTLEIELTETALVDNQNTAMALFRELAEIGVALCLDDFGTGHSPLAYVRIFPVRMLKIDPSFVREIGPEGGCPGFVNAILALARALDLEVVAEGVETALQREVLLARGCHEMQGFLFSPAVPEDALLALLRGGSLPAPDRRRRD